MDRRGQPEIMEIRRKNMRNVIAEIMGNRSLTSDMYEMILRIPEGTGQILPGQFIDLKIEGLYLRRPISICSWDEESITILYKTVGAGTERMSRMQAGESIDVLLPLGNGYDPEKTVPSAGEHPVLIGGGAGIPPMYGLCRSMIEAGRTPAVILGYTNAENMFYTEEFAKAGADVFITTEDGSAGIRGFVTDALADLPCSSVFACGPEPMLKAVDSALDETIPGFFSFEERMGCGFGACMGCSCETKYGSKRICKDGPVLERSEIIW